MKDELRRSSLFVSRLSLALALLERAPPQPQSSSWEKCTIVIAKETP